MPELSHHYGLQPRDLDDLSRNELDTYLAHLSDLRRLENG